MVGAIIGVMLSTATGVHHMRVVSMAEMMAMPPGTLYRQGCGTLYGPLKVFGGSSSRKTGHSWSWLEIGEVDGQDDDCCADYTTHFLMMEDLGASLPMGTQDYSGSNDFDDDHPERHRFLVIEREDLVKLRGIVDCALEACGN